MVAIASGLADAARRAPVRARRRARQHLLSTSTRAAVKDSADAPGGKEIAGGEIMSTGDWAPQENVAGVHLTDAAAQLDDDRALAGPSTVRPPRDARAATRLAAARATSRPVAISDRDDHAHHRLAGDPAGGAASDRGSLDAGTQAHRTSGDHRADQGRQRSATPA